MNTVCNEDCLHCPYEDCILETVTGNAFRDIIEVEKMATRISQKQCDHKRYRREYDKARYLANRDEKLCCQAVYAQSHREEIKRYKAEYLETHRDELKAYSAAYYKAHREIRAVQDKERYAAKKAELAAQNAAYRKQHSDEIKAKKREWYAAHKEEISARQREWRAAHRDEVNAQERERRRRKKERKVAAAMLPDPGGQQPIPAGTAAALGRAFTELQKNGNCDNVTLNSNQIIGG